MMHAQLYDLIFRMHKKTAPLQSGFIMSFLPSSTILLHISDVACSIQLGKARKNICS